MLSGPIALHPAWKSLGASAPWIGRVLKDPCFPQLGLGSVCLEPAGEERRKARDLPRQSEPGPAASLPRRCWVGLGWQPLCCYFSEVISEINHRTLSRGIGGLCCVQGDRRSLCCELEAKTEAAGQGTSEVVQVQPLCSAAPGERCWSCSLQQPWMGPGRAQGPLPLYYLCLLALDSYIFCK